MRKITRPVVAALVAGGLALGVGVLAPGVSLGQSAPAPTKASGTIGKLAFHEAMFKLWEDHVTWTRLFIVSFAAGLPDQNATAARLLQNQVDIGNAIKPFYGSAAGDKLTSLLQQHITTAVDVLTAAKAGDQAALQAALDDWYANARDIADFLHEANPENWGRQAMRSMMKSHLDLTLKEASDRLAGNFTADIGDYDAVVKEIKHMSDMLASGIIRQFPGRFS